MQDNELINSPLRLNSSYNLVHTLAITGDLRWRYFKDRDSHAATIWKLLVKRNCKQNDFAL